jgi:hypothetical protein
MSLTNGHAANGTAVSVFQPLPVLTSRAVWMDRVADLVRPMLARDFTGKVELNVSEGGITSVIVHEYRRPGRP